MKQHRGSDEPTLGQAWATLGERLGPPWWINLCCHLADAVDSG